MIRNAHLIAPRLRQFSRLLSILALLVLSLALSSNVLAQDPALILSKTIDGGVTSTGVGDIIRYRLRFECSSLSVSCGSLSITDALPAGLNFLQAQSSIPPGFNISYDAGTRLITLTKTDDFIDGTQFDAVIAAQVDYDLRPLPTTLENSVQGTIDPPGPTGAQTTTASAPPISIEPAVANWRMSKALYTPAINPTVNTNVTYQLQLCPVTTVGNVALRDIVVSDDLPPGAVFVSASDGGTEAGGLVTWNEPGPVYPPTCLIRFVTMRYNSTDFTVGQNVTNEADATGEYTDNNGNPGTPIGIDPVTITHPLEPVSEVPNYNKDDAGDPIGINATGRFNLDLNTLNSNSPSRDLVLIDNMPAELQVTEVRTGTWDVRFSNVRAFVEYSTNNATSWILFPGQPITYNTNASYNAGSAALPTNVTNMRWRFQYEDPVGTFNNGLPYGWSFTAQPQILFIPRQIAATTSNGLPLPIATAGSVYTNCLTVSRTNSGGPVNDPCNNESVTIQGDVASIRAFKNETPGAAWDEVGDPNITTFIPDSTILPGDTIRYIVSVTLTERSSAGLINPTLQDVMPAGLIFVRYSPVQLNGVDLPAAEQPVFTQSGQTLTWAWNTPSPTLNIPPLVAASQRLTLEFFARVPRGQAPGTYRNTMALATDSPGVVCEQNGEVDITDIDGDGDITETRCINGDNYIVERSAALRGEKWIRSTAASNNQVLDGTTFLPDPTCPNGGTAGMEGSNPFTRFPCISQAYPDGALTTGNFVPPGTSTTLDDFEYNLRIFNDGNIPMTEYVLYDILPYYGDTGSGGTLSSTSRQSEFQPVMRGPVGYLSGPPSLPVGSFTIEYNNSVNPCRPEVFNQPTGAILPAGCNNSWSTTWTAAARAFRIRMNAGLTLPETATFPNGLRFGVLMSIPEDTAPIGSLNNDDPQSPEIAWNSFSHTGSYVIDPVVGRRDLLASEPRKAGITIPIRLSVGNRVWFDPDNSGTINAADGPAPGIANVVVNLYRDVDGDNVPDGAAIATDRTDAEGYYLFSNIPFDSVVNNVAGPNNNRYIIGLPSVNFNTGRALELMLSSTGPGNEYVDPASANADITDNGRDVPVGDEVFSNNFTLGPTIEPSSEADLSNNVDDGLFGRRGVNGEPDTNSDLTIDFGFIPPPPFGTKSATVVNPNTIRWTMVWYNTGPAQAATVTDVLEAAQTNPSNLVCSTPGGGAGTITNTCTVQGGNTIFWSGTLGDGSTSANREANRLQITFTVTVPGAGVYNNSGTIATLRGVTSATRTVTVPPRGSTGGGGSGGSGGGGGNPVEDFLEDLDITSLKDITIVKLVDPPFALPGSTVAWTIMVINPNNQAIKDVTVSDDLPSTLTILSTKTTKGTFVISGQRVTLTIPTINPQEIVTLTITTRIKETNSFQIRNLADLFTPERGKIQSAEAMVLLVSELPRTGEMPRQWIIIRSVLTIMSVAGVVGLVMVKVYPRYR